jgi:hypothetical protein
LYLALGVSAVCECAVASKFRAKLKERMEEEGDEGLYKLLKMEQDLDVEGRVRRMGPQGAEALETLTQDNARQVAQKILESNHKNIIKTTLFIALGILGITTTIVGLCLGGAFPVVLGLVIGLAWLILDWPKLQALLINGIYLLHKQILDL